MHRLVIIFLCFASASFSADIHQWRDRDGGVHFGDLPPPDMRSERVTVKPNVYAGTGKPAAAPQQHHKVVLYSTAWCGYCRKARNYFRSHRIRFEEYDVEKSMKGKRDYKRLGARGVPIIFVGRQRLDGFSQAAFENLYRAR